MMYWIVFALFTCAETFTDVFFSWFPFYYEIKIVLVLWLLSPATKGSSILYRKFVHPMLSSREQEIDDYIAKAKEQGYHTVLNLGTKGVNYATTVIMQTAIKGGGGLVNQLKKSYSLSDLTGDVARPERPSRLEETQDTVDTRVLRRRKSPHRSSSGSGRMDMYFPEVDVRPGPSLSHVRSTEDVSSGYSSAEPLYVGQPPKLEAREGLVRTASVGGSSRPRTRATRTGLSTKKTTTVPEDSDSEPSGDELQSAKSHHSIQSTSTDSLSADLTTADSVKENSESSDNEFLDSVGFPSDTNTSERIESVSLVPHLEETRKQPQPPQHEGKIENEVPSYVETEIFSEAVNDEEPSDKVPVVEISKDEQNIQSISENTDESTAEPHETGIESITVSEITDVALIDDNTETSTDDTDNTIVEILLENIPKDDTAKVEIITETTDKLEIPSKHDETETDNSNKTTEPLITELKSEIESDTFNEITEPFNIETNKEISDIQSDTISLLSLSQRGGKYNKHAAPVPPAPSEPVEENPIKATLVLKPGIIKSLNNLSEETPTQIFLSHSPKAKRKHSKLESPLSKLMMLPRKLSFWGNKDADNKVSPKESKEDVTSRKSWHEESLSMPVSSKGSKSDTEYSCENLNVMTDERKSVSAVGIEQFKDKEDNKFVLRTLSHSPKTYRKSDH